MKLDHARDVEPRFSLGHLLVTPNALSSMHGAGIAPADLLLRHGRGDWGELSSGDWQANELALEEGARLLSAYTLPTKVRVWIITEADRSATTILLPHEY